MVSNRWIEPDRPETYHALPSYEREDYWHSMVRAVEVKSPDLVEINRFHDHRARVVGLFATVFLLVVMVIGIIRAYGSLEEYQAELIDSYDYVFNFDERMKIQYQNRVNRDQARRTESEFIADMKKGHQHRFLRSFLFEIIYWSVPLIFLLIGLFLPRFCPVRFDRRREIIYTWWRKKLYIADVGPFLSGLDADITAELDSTLIQAALFNTSTGPVAIAMHPIDRPDKIKKMLVGPYPNCHSHQNRDVLMFIKAFMSRNLYDAQDQLQSWDGTWLNKLQRGPVFFFDWLRWLGGRTLGPKRYFDEAKTEEALMSYLTDPKTRSRGQPAWRRDV